MEPRIQYAKTSDGVSIAYAMFGDGAPIVFTSNIWGDIHLIQSGTLHRKEMVERLVAQGRRVVAYDGRGMGSSDRSSTDFSLEARRRDLEAVVDRLDLESFVLCGRDHGVPAAVAYTVAQPRRVSQLILIEAYISGADFYGTVPVLRAVNSMRDMARDQWELFTETLGSLITGFTDVEHAKRSAETFRSGMTGEAFLSLGDASEEIDIGGLLSSVAVPTLVVHNTSFVVGNLGISREIASRIPKAELVTTDDPMRAIGDFLGLEAQARPESSPSGTAIILFADIVDSTALTERLGDDAFRNKARSLDEAMRSSIHANGGTPIEGKTLGDGVLAIFNSARQAIACAHACHAAANAAGLALHAGIHAGDVIREADNVYGGAVNVAARVAAASGAGETLVSDTVRSLARTSAGVTFEDRGEQALKGIDDPVRLFKVNR